jgi:hypothetical protein
MNLRFICCNKNDFVGTPMRENPRYRGYLEMLASSDVKYVHGYLGRQF